MFVTPATVSVVQLSPCPESSVHSHPHRGTGTGGRGTMYRIAGYIGGNNIWQIAQKRKKIAIGGYKFGDYGTIATPSPGVGAILADLILVV